MKQTAVPSLLSLQAVADQLQVTVRTIRNFISLGLLPAHRIGPRLLRVKADDVVRLIGEPIPTAAHKSTRIQRTDTN
jgi:excisionase family DNA binding protein